MSKSSGLRPLPPLEPTITVQALVLFPHHALLAARFFELSEFLRVRLPPRELLVEGAFLLQMVALGTEGTHVVCGLIFTITMPHCGHSVLSTDGQQVRCARISTTRTEHRMPRPRSFSAASRDVLALSERARSILREMNTGVIN